MSVTVHDSNNEEQKAPKPRRRRTTYIITAIVAVIALLAAGWFLQDELSAQDAEQVSMAEEAESLLVYVPNEDAAAEIDSAEMNSADTESTTEDNVAESNVSESDAAESDVSQDETTAEAGSETPSAALLTAVTNAAAEEMNAEAATADEVAAPVDAAQAVSPSESATETAPVMLASADGAAPTVPTQNSLRALAGGSGATLYDSPNGEALQTFAMAQPLIATGRSDDGAWIRIEADGLSGWVAANQLLLFNAESLPLADAEADAADEVVAQPGQAEQASERTIGEGEMMATVTLQTSRLNVRSAPNTEGRIIGKAMPNDRYAVLARNAAGSWVQIALDDGEFGWVAARFMELNGTLEELPVSTEMSDAPSFVGEPLSGVGAGESNPAPTAAVDETGAAAGTEPAAISGANTGGDANTLALDGVASVDAAVEPRLLSPDSTSQVEMRFISEEGDGLDEATMARIDAASAANGFEASAAGLSGKLAFVAEGNRIHLYDLATGELRFLANGYDPDISRDGSLVAFARGSDIYTINVDGSNEQLAFSDGDRLSAPTFSPDGEYIAFTSVTGSEKCYDTPFACLPTSPSIPDELAGTPIEGQIEEQYAEALGDFDIASINQRKLSRVRVNGEDFRDLPALQGVREPDWNENGITYSAGGIQITADEPDAENRPVVNQGWWRDPDWQPGGGRIAFFERAANSQAKSTAPTPTAAA